MGHLFIFLRQERLCFLTEHESLGDVYMGSSQKTGTRSQLNNSGDQLANLCHKLLSYSLFSFNNYGVFHAMKFQKFLNTAIVCVYMCSCVCVYTLKYVGVLY